MRIEAFQACDWSINYSDHWNLHVKLHQSVLQLTKGLHQITWCRAPPLLFKTSGLCCRQISRKEICVTFVLQSSPSCTSGCRLCQRARDSAPSKFSIRRVRATCVTRKQSTMCARQKNLLNTWPGMAVTSYYTAQKLKDWCCHFIMTRCIITVLLYIMMITTWTIN